MENFEKIEKKMMELTSFNKMSINYESWPTKELTPLTIKEKLFGECNLLFSDLDNGIFVISFRDLSRFAGAKVGIEYTDKFIRVISIAKEGLIKQNIAKKNSIKTFELLFGYNQKKCNKVFVFLLVFILLTPLYGCNKSEVITDDESQSTLRQEYITITTNYQTLVDAYNEESNKLGFKGFGDVVESLSVPNIIKDLDSASDKKIESEINQYVEELQDIVVMYKKLLQLDTPEESWIISKLSNIENITEIGAVTQTNDPNGLLGKDGGYYSCIYFTLDSIDKSISEGKTAVDKGTDYGGAIELYKTHEDAISRKEYLDQFSGTLLNAGSCEVVGTIVIRVSYILPDEDQDIVTKTLIKAFISLVSE